MIWAPKREMIYKTMTKKTPKFGTTENHLLGLLQPTTRYCQSWRILKCNLDAKGNLPHAGQGFGMPRSGREGTSLAKCSHMNQTCTNILLDTFLQTKAWFPKLFYWFINDQDLSNSIQDVSSSRLLEIKSVWSSPIALKQYRTSISNTQSCLNSAFFSRVIVRHLPLHSGLPPTL